MITITARDFPSILGVSPYTTPFQCLCEKIEKNKTFFGNKMTEHGVKYERIAIQKYSNITTNVVNTKQSIRTHPIYPWITGKIDGLTQNNCVVEIKCPWSPPVDTLTTVPIIYWIQCQVYMNLVDTEVCHYVEYYQSHTVECDNSIAYLSVARDREWWATSIPKIIRFKEQIDIYTEHGLHTHPIRIAEAEWALLI